MRELFPTKPYDITKSMWDEYYSVQKSGVMNMMDHDLVGYMMQDNAYSQAFKHFEDEGNEETLTIE